MGCFLLSLQTNSEHIPSIPNWLIKITINNDSYQPTSNQNNKKQNKKKNKVGMHLKNNTKTFIKEKALCQKNAPAEDDFFYVVSPKRIH